MELAMVTSRFLYQELTVKQPGKRIKHLGSISPFQLMCEAVEYIHSLPRERFPSFLLIHLAFLLSFLPDPSHFYLFPAFCQLLFEIFYIH